MMGSKYYKFVEIELTPKLLHKLLEWAKDPKTTPEHLRYAVDNMKLLAYEDECMALDEFEAITEKPLAM